MVDVHKHVITLMDPISAPAGMVLRWIMIITHVLVCIVWHTLVNYVIQILLCKECNVHTTIIDMLYGTIGMLTTIITV